MTLPCMLGEAVALPCMLGGAVTLPCILEAARTAEELECVLGREVTLACMLSALWTLVGAVNSWLLICIVVQFTMLNGLDGGSNMRNWV